MPAPTTISPSRSTPKSCWRRVRALLRRAAGLATSEIEIGALRIDTRASRVTVDGNPVKLTSLEYRLLAYLAHHRGKVVSRTELVEHLYDQDFDRDSNTIEVFVGRLRKKLDADLIQTVRGLGYCLDVARCQAPIRFNSLAFRLIAAAAVWTVLALVAGGLILSNAFRTSVQGDFDAELQTGMDGLVAAAGYDSSGAIQLEPRYLSAKFQRAYSGDYWQIAPAGGGKAMISHSLLDRTIRFSDFQKAPNGMIWGHADGPDQQHLRVLSRRIEFPITATARPDDSRAYMFTVASDMSEVDRRIRNSTAR